MARLARAVVPNRPRHVTQRGNRRQQTDWQTERIAGRMCAWEQRLRQPDEEAFAKAMRLHEHTGRPLGDKPFARRSEQLLGRRLLPGRPGRPSKDKPKAYGVSG